MDVLTSLIYSIDHESEKSLMHQESARISNAVIKFVDKLHEGIIKLSSIYEAEIICAGSFYDDLKIENPNEFDFNIELKHFVFGKNFILQSSGFKGTRNLWRTNQNDSIYKKIHFIDNEFASEWHGNDKTVNVGTKHQPEYILSPVGVKNEYLSFATEIMKSMVMPRYLTLIGVVDLSGPAISIDLIWSGRQYKNLKVNVDISLAISLPPEATPFNPEKLFPENHPLFYAVKEYAEQKHGYAAVPYVSGVKKSQNSWRLSTGYLEAFIFQAFKRNSGVKILLRFLKYEREALIKSLEFLPKEYWGRTSEKVAILTESPFGVFSVPVPIMPQLEEMRSISMLNVSSYGLKQFILYMLRQSDTLQSASVGEKYIDFLVIWHKASKKGFIENFFFPKHKIYVGEFEDCFETFETILSWIRDVMISNNVAKHDQAEIWDKLCHIYDDLTPMYDEMDLLPLFPE